MALCHTLHLCQRCSVAKAVHAVGLNQEEKQKKTMFALFQTAS